MKFIAKFIVTVLLLFLPWGIANASENLLGSKDFSSENGWVAWMPKAASEAGCTFKFENGRVIFKSVATTEQKPSFLQLSKVVQLEAGKRYKIKLRIKSNKSGLVPVYYNISKPPFTIYAGAKITLNVGENDYDCAFIVKKAKVGEEGQMCRLMFFWGGLKDADIEVSNITLTEIK